MKNELKDVALKIFLAKANLLGKYSTEQNTKDAAALVEACFDYARMFIETAEKKCPSPQGPSGPEPKPYVQVLGGEDYFKEKPKAPESKL